MLRVGVEGAVSGELLAEYVLCQVPFTVDLCVVVRDGMVPAAAVRTVWEVYVVE
jgi:hypothetical protein